MAVLPVTTVGNIQSALGRDLTTTETTRATYYINAISAYIASYCDLISFEEVLDDTIRAQADCYGIITLGGGPISVVTSVTAVDGTEVFGWTFDGASELVGLAPFQTVDIVYSHGLTEIPDDLEGVATEAVIGAVQLQTPSARLVRRTVGDVTDAYAEGSGVGITLEENILNRYHTSEYTMRLGSRWSGNGDHNYPPNWFQISG